MVQKTKTKSPTPVSKYPGADCAKCPLVEKGFVPPSGPKDAKILFLGQAPTSADVRKGEMLTGASGAAFDGGLVTHGLERKDVRIDSTILCNWFSSAGQKPPSEAVMACSGHLDLDSPEVIVPLGNDALGSLTGQTEGITSVAGSIIERDGKKIIPMSHPSSYLRSNTPNYQDFLDTMGLIKDLDDGHTFDHIGKQYRIVQSKKEALQLFDWLEKNPPEDLAVDLETDYADVGGCLVTALSLAWEEHIGYVIPWDSKYLESHDSKYLPLLEDWDVYNACKRALEAQTGVIAHNAPFDVTILRREDINIQFKIDTLLMHYAYDERTRAQGLKTVAKYFLGVGDWEEDLKKYLKKKADPYTNIPPDVLYPYAGMDVCTTLALKRKLVRLFDLPENEGPKRLFYETLMPLCEMMVKMGPIGAKMDVVLLEKALMTMPAKLDDLREELTVIAEDPLYNPGSYLDNRKMLFVKFGLPKIKGNSTDADVLDALSGHKFVDTLLEYRQYKKVVGTYLLNMAREYRDGRGYPDLKLFGTVTGRLTANKLNPLVFPRETRGDLYAVAKHIFVADDDSFLMQSDFSGMELRILAVLSQDPFMLEVLADVNEDWHATMASEIFGDEFRMANDAKRKELRVIAKMLVFGLNYGRGVVSISIQLGCYNKANCSRCQTGRKCVRAVKEATELVEAYFKPIPRVKEYRRELLVQVKTVGYLETPFGRRRRFPMITPDNWKAIEKQIYNFPMQATGNDCNMHAMKAVYDKYGNRARPLWPVHDAALFNMAMDLSADEVADILHIFSSTPSKLLKTDLPFFIDTDMGARWGTMKKYKDCWLQRFEAPKGPWESLSTQASISS